MRPWESERSLQRRPEAGMQGASDGQEGLQHCPVLPDEVLTGLNVQPGEVSSTELWAEAAIRNSCCIIRASPEQRRIKIFIQIVRPPPNAPGRSRRRPQSATGLLPVTKCPRMGSATAFCPSPSAQGWGRRRAFCPYPILGHLVTGKRPVADPILGHLVTGKRPVAAPSAQGWGRRRANIGVGR